MLDDPRKSIWIDVSSAENKHNFAASELRQFSFQKCRKRSGACAFDHSFFQFGNTQNCARDCFLRNSHNLFDSASCHFKCERSNFWNRQTIGERRFGGHSYRMTCCQGCGHAWTSQRFHADHFGCWAQSLGDKTDASDQSTSTNRNDNCIWVRALFKDFQSARSCTSDDVRIIESIDISQPFCGNKFIGALTRISNVFAVHQHIRTKFAASNLLHKRCESWHDDCDCNSKRAAVIRKRECMISSACSDDSLGACRCIQLHQRISTPAFFERTCGLLIIQLAPNICTTQL